MRLTRVAGLKGKKVSRRRHGHDARHEALTVALKLTQRATHREGSVASALATKPLSTDAGRARALLRATAHAQGLDRMESVDDFLSTREADE